MGIVLTVALLVFGVGYLIGLAIFSGSEARIGLGVLCGVCAVLVVTGVVFAGCAMMLKGL